MFTKFEFLKGGKTEEDGPEGTDDQSQPGELDLPEDRPIPALSRLPPPPSVLENEESCNMWHLFNYFDESCVDLTEVYSSGNVRSLSRNCSTPAPGVNPTAGGAAHPTGVGQIFDSHDISSNHRTSFGGGGSDAHDASWMCVVNMADLHSQDSSNAADLHNKFTDRSRQGCGGIYQSFQSNTVPTTSAGQQSAAAVSSAPDSTVDTKVLQFSAVPQLKNEQTAPNVITLQPSIMTLSDFKDYRVHIKQQGYDNSNAVMNDSTPLSVATSTVTSHITTRPILVLTSCQPMTVSTPIEKPVKSYPKPAYSYSCLIAMALKNSTTGVLPVNEIYTFMTENFPYFQTAPDGWKNSVRHNLSLNKCFRKIDNPNTNGHARKGCLWGLNESRIAKMDEEIVKWRKKDPEGIRRSMYYPDRLEAIEKGIISASINSPASTNTTGTFVLGDDVLIDLYPEPSDATLTQKIIGSEDVLDELLYAGMDGKLAGVGGKPAITFVRSTQTMLKNNSPAVAFNSSRQAEVSRSFTIRAEI